MTKKIIETIIYSPVKLTDIQNREYVGWLLPAQNKKGCYCILPISLSEDIQVFRATHIKYIKHLRNGVVLGKEELENASDND